LSPFKFPRKRRGPSGPTLNALIGVFLFFPWTLALAETVGIDPNHPQSYTVVEGDTLWGIAGRFLNNPWEWPEIWHDNPQIRNPNLIYPGDVLYPGDVVVLDQANGSPRLRVETPSELRLSPQVRSSPLDAAIPAIPMKVIGPFLTRPKVLGTDELAGEPYVVALADEHVVGGTGNRIYVRSIEPGGASAYTVFRRGHPYQDPETGTILGYEALYIGDSQLEQTGDPATLLLTRTEKEARTGDRLLAATTEAVRVSFQPHAPKFPLRGHIVGVVDGVTQIGQYSVVAISRGSADGIEAGHVLEIRQKGPVIRDTVHAGFGETVAAPEQKAGMLMVFRPFERVSYALVMNATRSIHVLDIVQTP
jgi:hypothetical protein